MATQGGWSDLPDDLVRIISTKLHDIADFINIGAVCKTWRTATSMSDLPPQIPWLLERPDPTIGVLRFYSLFSDRVRTVQCPQSLGKLLSGPSHGYLYTANFLWDNQQHSLLNPLTKHEVTIPFTGHLVHPRLVGFLVDPIKNDYMGFMDYLEDDEYMEGDWSRLMGFYRPVSHSWDHYLVQFENMVTCGAILKGSLYLQETGTRDTSVIAIAIPRYCIVPAPPETINYPGQVYYVELGEKILRINKKKDLSLVPPIIFFDIYELEGENGQAQWVKISCTGDQVLFLDNSNGISVTASGSNGLKGNSIYWLESIPVRFHYEDGLEGVRNDIEAWRYNIEDGQTEKTRCPFDISLTWFMPSTDGSLPDDSISSVRNHCYS